MAIALQQRHAPGWRPAGRCTPRPRLRSSVLARDSLPGHGSMGPWDRLQLARRKLELAVRVENYAAAAEAKREVDLLTEHLPASKALLNGLLEKLARLAADADTAIGGAGAGQDVGQPAAQRAQQEALLAQHVATLAQLGELGDWDAAPALAAALHDGDEVAAGAEEALWALFMACPTPELHQRMQQGVVLMRRPEQWDQALQLFNDMVRAAPTFAEAYNKRATVLYLTQRYADAIKDCRVVLQLNPYHFAAASGLGMCCGAVGDNAGALAAFQQAVAINPRMRHLRQHIMQLRQAIAEEAGEERAEADDRC